MKLRRLALLCAVILIAIALSACSNAAPVTIGNEQLNFVKLDMTDSYAGISSAQGSQILTVKFMAKSENPDLSKISEAFFGQTPSTLSDGKNSYPCKSIAFEKDGSKIIIVTIFEVPSNLRSGVSTLTLSGSAFQTIQLKI